MRDIFLEETQSRIEDSAERAKSNIEQKLIKRFYTEVSVSAQDGAYRLLLDGRGAKTPSRAPLALPNEPLAQAVAQEWRDQDKLIDPRTMPMTRLTNAAIEGGAGSIDAQVEEILRYAGNDLLCYRAENPDGLVARQGELWDPVLDYFRDKHGLKFVLTQTITHVAQPRGNEAKVRVMLERFELFGLSALSSLLNLCGSALLPLALAHGAVSGDAAWAAAHLEEDWNIEAWGQDGEAQERRVMRRREYDAAVSLLGFMVRD